MGYTHYWYQKRDFTEEEWGQLTAATRLAIESLPERFETAECEYEEKAVIRGWNGKGKPVINGEEIRFNGQAPDLDHETFSIQRSKEAGTYRERGYTNDKGEEGVFHFCKTARKPYDLLVCAVLLLATEIAPGCLDVSSDGDMRGREWQPAREFVKSLGESARVN